MPAHARQEISGVVEDIFAHRFVVKTSEGKTLADLTPKGMEKVNLRVGAKVALKGEMKPSELKVDEIVIDGRSVTIEHKPKDDKGPKGPKKHHDHDPAAATKAVEKEGYEILATPIAKPKHFEILAKRGEDVAELHVELDGKIRKEKLADRADAKWRHAS